MLVVKMWVAGVLIVELWVAAFEMPRSCVVKK